VLLDAALTMVYGEDILLARSLDAVKSRVAPAPALRSRDVGRGDLAERRASVRAHFERELSWSAVGRKALAINGAVAAARRESLA
jgi:hypothetical protein